MRGKLKSGFAGEVFDKRRSRSAHLAEYFLIYTNYLQHEQRTASNELVEFLEQPNPGQTVIYFGLFYNGKPCGFATLMLYENAGIAIVDHIAIAPTVRGLGAFFMFCDLIAEYLDRQKRTYNYIVVEVVLSGRLYTTGLNPLMLLRLTRFVGFRLANIPYLAPESFNLAHSNPERAALMLLCQPDRSDIPSDEMLRVVNVIYNDHYIAWYKRTMAPQEFEKYRVAALAALESITDFVKRERIIKINGMKNLNLPYTVDPVRKPPLRIIYFIVLMAIPTMLTIAVSFTQEPMLTLGVLAASCLAYASLFIPGVRNLVFRSFQQE